MEELLKELKESRDKLIHQDHAAKSALQMMQKEMTHRLEQVGLDRLFISYTTFTHISFFLINTIYNPFIFFNIFEIIQKIKIIWLEIMSYRS